MNDRRSGPITQGPIPDRAGQITHRLKVVSLLVAMAVLGVILYLLRFVLLPFVLAAIVAYVCTPLIDNVRRRTDLPRWLVALATLLVLLGIVAAVGWLALPPLGRYLANVASDLRGTLTGLFNAFLGDHPLALFGRSVTAGQLGDSAASDIQRWLDSNGLREIAFWSFSGIAGILLSLVILGYLFFDAPRIGSGLFWLIPPRHRSFAETVWREIDPILRRYFVGIALVVIYASVAAYLGLGLILGLPHAFVLAVVTGILEVIPMVGPAAAALIAGLVAVEQAKSGWSIVAYIIYAIALRISIDQFVGPIVLSRAAYLRPVLVIFCFLIGGTLYGVLGVILAVPMALTIKIVLTRLYERGDNSYS